MVVDYLYYVKSIATFALIFYGYIILVLASVYELLVMLEGKIKETPFFNGLIW